MSRIASSARRPRALLRGVLGTLTALILGAVLVTAGSSAVAAEQPSFTAVTPAAPVMIQAPKASGVDGAFSGISIVPMKLDDDSPNAIDAENAKKNVYETQLRVMNRWADTTTNFFTKYDGFVGTQLIDQAQRGLNQTTQMYIGNALAKLTSGAVTWAVSFDALNTIGAQLDKVTGYVIRALFTNGSPTAIAVSSLMAVLVVFLILGVIWRAARNGGARLAFRRLGGIAVLLGLILGMSAQALSATSTSDATGYHPVILTPGWVVKTVNDGVSSLAEVPARTFVDGVQPMVDTINSSTTKTDSGTYYDPKTDLSCARFQQSLYNSLQSANKVATQNGAGSTVAITAVMDQLWQETGLQTWKQVQTGFNNPYGEKMFCRILENRSSQIDPVYTALYTYYGQDDPGTWRAPVFADQLGTNAPFAPATSQGTAKTYVAWAACKPTGVNGGEIQWQWEPGWVGFQGGVAGVGGSGGGSTTLGKDADAQDNCGKWWKVVANNGDDGDIPGTFDISGQVDWINDRTKNAVDKQGVRDFLFALTGLNATGGATATAVYPWSQGMQFLAFGGLSAVTAVAKLFVAFFIVAFLFVLVSELFSSGPFGERIVRAFNKFLGVTIFASMLTVIMTFVSLFSRILIASVNGLVGPGNIVSMAVSGFAPVIALVITHFMFTKLFRMPSPVSVRGLQAWSKAGLSGALGGAAASAAGGFIGARTGGRLADMAKSRAKAQGNAALHRATGGKFGKPLGTGSGGRRSGMDAIKPGARDTALEEGLDAVTKSPKQVRKEARQAAQTELNSARAWWRENNPGKIAPGDLKGSLADLRDRGAQRARDLGLSAQQKLAESSVGRELAARSEYRQALRDARRVGGRAALEEARDAQREKLGKVTAGLAAVMDAPAAVANRARLGVEAVHGATKQTATQAWNSKAMLDARERASAVARSAQKAGSDVAWVAAKGSQLLAESRAGQISAKAGHGAAVVGRAAQTPLRATARGAANVAARKQNNADVIGAYREAMAAKKAASERAEGSGSGSGQESTAPRSEPPRASVEL